MDQSLDSGVPEVDFSVLSFDGGGIRGLSSLLILRAIMRQKIGSISQPIYPWMYFTIICGTSTGGLIALMLGRLRMSIDEAITAYIKLGEEIFSPTKWFWKEGKYKAKNLERAVKRIVGKAGDDEDKPKRSKKEFMRGFLVRRTSRVKIRDEEYERKGEGVMMIDDRPGNCKTFVCSMTSVNLERPTHFRTYPVTTNAIADCRIWEAARATSASPYFFKPMAITDPNGIVTTYVDGGLRCNNPTRRLIEEMDLLGLSNKSACILSIGTGQSATITIPRAGGAPKEQLLGVSQALRRIAMDCEEVERNMTEDYENGRMQKYTYVRLNVQHGMQGVGLEEWKKTEDIQQHTLNYLRNAQVAKDVKNLLKCIRLRPECSHPL